MLLTNTGDNYIVTPITSASAQRNLGRTLRAPSVGESVDQGIYATYRKDYYLPQYQEYPEPPLKGGRFHLATIAQVSGQVTAVNIDGVDLEAQLKDSQVQDENNLVEWFHVWPEKVIAGKPVWVAFHSRDSRWDSKAEARIQILVGNEYAVNGIFAVKTTRVPLTYVTTTEDLQTLLIHLKNTDSVAHRMTRLLVNGYDVVAAAVASIPSATIKPKESVLWTVPLSQPAQLGEAWTVVVEYQDANPAVGVGRIIKPFFPIEAWNNTSQCPFPTGNTSEYNQFLDAGFDTTYIHPGVGSACQVSLDNLINKVLPASSPALYALLESGLSEQYQFSNTSAIAGFMTGDESDGTIYEDGKPKAWEKAQKSRAAWPKYPQIPTFNGGKTNRNIGTFAGIADIQGMDFYLAACAPHITRWGSSFPLYLSYDYLCNARKNQMPLPTWLYTQGLASAWNVEFLGRVTHRQPKAREILIQGLGALAAGAKGLMWFQINAQEREREPSAWSAIKKVNWIARGVRKYLREGDVTGMARATGKVIVEAIRAREALIVIVINADVEESVTDLECLNISTSPHWKVHTIKTDIAVTIPDDLGIKQIFEVADRQETHGISSYSVSDRQLTLQSIQLDDGVPARLFVLGANDNVRNEVMKAMT